MPWIKFSDRKPKESIPLITRFPGNDGGDAIESHNSWHNDSLKTFDYMHGGCRISHWWDGPFDFDLAVSEWHKSHV